MSDFPVSIFENCFPVSGLLVWYEVGFFVEHWRGEFSDFDSVSDFVFYCDFTSYRPNSVGARGLKFPLVVVSVSRQVRFRSGSRFLVSFLFRPEVLYEFLELFSSHVSKEFIGKMDSDFSELLFNVCLVAV